MHNECSLCLFRHSCTSSTQVLLCGAEMQRTHCIILWVQHQHQPTLLHYCGDSVLKWYTDSAWPVTCHKITSKILNWVSYINILIMYFKTFYYSLRKTHGTCILFNKHMLKNNSNGLTGTWKWSLVKSWQRQETYATNWHCSLMV